MDGFKNTTRTQYVQGDRDLPARAARNLDPKGSVMAGDTARYGKGGKVMRPAQKKGK